MKRNFKNVILGFSFTILTYSEALAVIQTGTDCDGKCNWVYDSEAEGGPSLVFTAKEGATGELAIKNNYYRFYGVNGGYNLNLQPKNIIVGEGITSIDPGSRNPFESVGVGGGKLTLPSTLKEWKRGSSWGMSFSTIEINSDELVISEKAIRNTSPTGILTIIMPESSDITFDANSIDSCAGGNPNLVPFTQTLNIQCKGAKATCDESLAGVKATIEANGGTYNSDYYSEKNENEEVTLQYFDDGYRVLNDQGFYDVYDMAGNLTGYSNLSGREIYDQNGTLLERYDENGNMLDGMQSQTDGSFRILKDGKVVGFKNKRIYTVDEATIVTKNNKNTFKLKYR